MNFIERMMRPMPRTACPPRQRTGAAARQRTRGWRARAAATLVALGAFGGPAAAHDARLGALRIDHPYATPTPPGAANGAAYLRGIRNTGDQPDRLIGASTPVAQHVEIHRGTVDAGNVMRMRAVDGIDLPPKTEVPLRHGGEHHLMLTGLTRPLKAGDRFPMTLRFQKAGEREVTVWVQTPRDGADGQHKH